MADKKISPVFCRRNGLRRHDMGRRRPARAAGESESGRGGEAETGARSFLIRNSRKLNAKEMVMSRKHVPWLAVAILLISVGNARAQRGGAHHGAVGGHYGGAGGFHHPGHWGAQWGWGYPVYDYPVWDGDWYGLGYDYGMTGLGDLYAGQGAYLQGAGASVLNEAMAGEIANHTSMMANEYMYAAQREANRRYALRRVNQRQHLVAMRRGIDERLVFNPTERDITVGDALNAAAELVKRHKPFRLAPGQINAAIPGRCLGDLTFVLAAENVRINLRGLSDPDQWPMSLRDNLYAAERAAYETAIDRVIRESRRGGITRETLRLVDTTVERLRLKLDNAPPLDFYDRDEAKRHVTAMAATARMLHSRRAGEALQDLQISPPRTLGTLIGFMTTHSLRFGPAQTSRQQKAHQDFYPILADALQKVLVASRNGDPQVAMQVTGDEAGRPE